MASVDPVYGVNDFNETKVLSESQTLINNILMILFGKPGFYPSIPWLGMDIYQYLYRFDDEIDTLKIKSKLAAQCQEFLPDIQNGSMDVYSTTHQERPVLIFELPILVDKATSVLALGVTVNTKGEMVYNFVSNDEVQII